MKLQISTGEAQGNKKKYDSLRETDARAQAVQSPGDMSW